MYSLLFTRTNLWLYTSWGLCFYGFLSQNYGLMIIGIIILSALIIYQNYKKNELINALKKNAAPHYLLNQSTQSTWDEIEYIFDKYKQNYEKERLKKDQQLENLESIIQELPFGLILLEADLIEWLNPKACSYLHLDLKKDLNQNISYLVRQPLFIEFISQTQTTSIDIKHHEKDLRIHRIPYKQNQYMLLLEDISTKNILDHSRKKFVAHASHELKTPLTIIIGLLESIQTLPLHDTQKNKYIKIIQTHSQNMLDLIHRLLDLAQVESQTNQALSETICMEKLIKKTIEDTEHIRRRGQLITIKKCDSIILYGEEYAIYTCVINLLKNAITHCPENTAIEVSWEAIETGEAQIEVSDDGFGIKKSDMPYVTQRFYRSSDSKGHGLGLSIVKHHVTRHQGIILIDNKKPPEHGARFMLRFPLSRLAFKSH